MKKIKEKLTAEQEKELITSAFEKLLHDYENSNHRKRTEVIKKAFYLANNAHAGAKRKSGEPYILHPIEVAEICCNEIGLGSTSIASALLHDVVEDTDYTVKDIQDIFGETIAKIVDGLTKLSKEALSSAIEKHIPLKRLLEMDPLTDLSKIAFPKPDDTTGLDEQSKILDQQPSFQLENIRKLLLLGNRDIRVILVKIADRLHNMRTLDSMPALKQAKIAAETRLFYAPLAERLGMYDIKTELENLSLKYDHPEDYKKIKKLIKSCHQTRDDYYDLFTKKIKDDLDRTNLKYEIQHREKSVYSIWRKMKVQQISFSQIHDLFALRIIFEPSKPEHEVSDCFNIYALISKKFNQIDGRFKDFVTRPKPNGYMSLHMTIMLDSGQTVEIQIRSKRMHDLAEKGLAAHWRYKVHAFKVDRYEENILSNVKALLKNPGPEASDDYEDLIFNFSHPEEILVNNASTGDPVKLPSNTSILDYAYKIDTETGNHCIGGRVNHEMVEVNYLLNNGDQVEVITTSKTKPKREWLKYVNSPKAIRAINNYLQKEEDRQERDGKDKLRQFMESNNINVDMLDEWHHPPIPEYQSLKDFYIDIDRGIIPFNARLAGAITSKSKDVNPEPTKELSNLDYEAPSIDPAKIKETQILQARNGHRNYIRAECCRPIKGERVEGILNNKNQIVVHKKLCRNCINQRASHGDRIIGVTWGQHINSPFKVRLYIDGFNLNGFVFNFIKGLREENVELLGINFKDHGERVMGEVKISVKDVKQLDSVLQLLQENNKDVLRAYRVDDDPNQSYKLLLK